MKNAEECLDWHKPYWVNGYMVQIIFSLTCRNQTIWHCPYDRGKSCQVFFIAFQEDDCSASVLCHSKKSHACLGLRYFFFLLLIKTQKVGGGSLCAPAIVKNGEQELWAFTSRVSGPPATAHFLNLKCYDALACWSWFFSPGVAGFSSSGVQLL